MLVLCVVSCLCLWCFRQGRAKARCDPVSSRTKARCDPFSWSLWCFKQCRAEAWQARRAGQRKHDILGARCAEPSEARLRAADGWMVCVIIVKESHVSDGASELQSASSLSSSVKRWFVLIPLARFPFLLSQVFTFVYKMNVKPYILIPIEVPKEGLKSRNVSIS